MSLKTDLTPTKYTHDVIVIQKDGKARVRVYVYNDLNERMALKWINLNFTTKQKKVLIDKRDEVLSQLATENNFVEKTS